MKKIKSGLICSALLLCCSLSLNAQPPIDEYYRFHWSSTQPYDHGASNSLIESTLSGNSRFVVTGGTLSHVIPVQVGQPPNPVWPAAFMTKYDINGVPLSSRIYQLKKLQVLSCMGTSVAEISGPGLIPGYGIVAFYQDSTHNANGTITFDQVSMLIRTDVNGDTLWTRPVSEGPSTTVIFDAAKSALVVSGSTGGTASQLDIQLTSFDAATGNLLFRRSYQTNGTSSHTPGRMILDPATGNYVICGSQVIAGTRNPLLIVTDNSGNPQCIQTFSQFDFMDGVDVVTGANPNTYVVACIKARTIYRFGQPLVQHEIVLLEVSSTTCPGLIRASEEQPTFNDFYFSYFGVSIVRTDRNEYLVAGRQIDLTGLTSTDGNGFLARFNSNFASQSVDLYGNPGGTAGEDDFRDLIYISVPFDTMRLVACGTNQRFSPWLQPPFSNPGENYPWLAGANDFGQGTCSNSVLTFVDIPLSLPNTSYASTYKEPIEPLRVKIEVSTPDSEMENQCQAPNRLAAPHKQETFSVYPNPSSGQIKLSSSAMDASCDLEIYNAEGQLVLKQTLTDIHTEETIDLSNQPAGVFFLLLKRNDEIVYQEKVVLIR